MYSSEVSTKTRVAGRTTGVTVNTRPRMKRAYRHISFSGGNIAYLLHKCWWDCDGNEKAKRHYLISLYRPTLVYDVRLRTIVRHYGQYRELKFIDDQRSLVFYKPTVVILAR